MEKKTLIGTWLVIEKIKEGNYAFVYKVNNINDKRQAALKWFISPHSSKEVKREWSIHRKISSHPHCHPYILCAYEFGPRYIVSELMTGDMTRFIRGRENAIHIENSKCILYLSFQMLKGLSALHKTGIAHNDVKPENILYRIPESDRGDEKYFNTFELVRERMECKLGDLGWAHMQKKDGDSARVTPQHFLQLQSNDVWRLGAVLRQMFLDPTQHLSDFENHHRGLPIPPARFKGRNPTDDHAINILLNDLVTLDWEKRLQTFSRFI